MNFFIYKKFQTIFKFIKLNLNLKKKVRIIMAESTAISNILID